MTKRQMILDNGNQLARQVRATQIYTEVTIVEQRQFTIIVKCPYCQRLHSHGLESRGHVVGHCWELDSPGYIITEPNKKRKAGKILC